MTQTITVTVLEDQRVAVSTGDNLGLGLIAREDAQASAAAAELSEAAAESLVGPTYASTAAGLAAVAEGESFAVDNGDGTVSIYREDGGVAVLQRQLATTAALAATAGGERIGLSDGSTLQAFRDGFGGIVTPDDSAAAVASKIAAAAADEAPALVSGNVNTAAITTATDRMNAGALAGDGRLEKTANGALWTHSGDYSSFRDLWLDGNALEGPFTGANLVLSDTTGQTGLFNVHSIEAEDQALLAAGPVHVFGGLYYTRNSDTAVADIQIGTSGTASLYSVLCGVRTSQDTHGLYEIDTGNTFRMGCQFGNVTIDQSGAPPAGINGGHTVGCRIIGNLTINQSNALFSSNLIAGDVTIAAGTGGVTLGPSNTVGPTKKVDQLGNSGSNYVCINRGTGTATDALGGIDLWYGSSGTGASGAAARWWIAPSANSGTPDPANARIGTPGKLFARSMALLDSAGTATFDIIANPSASNVNVGGATGFLQLLASATDGVIFTISGATTAMAVKGDGLYAAGNKVVGARGAAVADATDAASAITQLNALLARLRAHGLISA